MLLHDCLANGLDFPKARLPKVRDSGDRNEAFVGTLLGRCTLTIENHDVVTGS